MMNDDDLSPEQEAAWQVLLKRCDDQLDHIAVAADRTAAISAMLLVSLRAYEDATGTEGLIELLESLTETARSKRLLMAEPVGGTH